MKRADCSCGPQSQSWLPASLATAALVATGAGDRAAAQTPGPTAVKVPTVRLHLVASGLSQPLGVVPPPGDTKRLFIVEKTGYIRVMQNGKLLAKPFLDVHGRVSAGGEQGLLSLAFDPAYATNRRFYVYYTGRNGDIKVVRYLTGANPDVANAASAKVLWTVAHHVNSNHNGGQLAFGPDGRLYIGVGDGGSEGDPSSTARTCTCLRQDLDHGRLEASPRPVLYAYGLRNPWRFSFDPATGNLWIGGGQGQVGRDRLPESRHQGGDQLRLELLRGRSRLQAPVDRAHAPVFPVSEYSHALGDAVVGGYVYRGSAIAALKGRYLFADYGTARVWFKTSPGAAAHILTGISQKLPNVSSFGQNAQGELFLSSLNGKVYKLVP